jgi:hypothetical protein
MLPVSLDFVVFFFVLCTLCCQFLWIVFVVCFFVLCTLCCQFFCIVHLFFFQVLRYVIENYTIFVRKVKTGWHCINMINISEYRRGNKNKWTIQKNWQHRVYKTKKNKAKTQHNMCLTPLYANKQK